MQILRSGPPEGGHHVRVRGARWRVTDVRPYDDCQIVTLTALTPPHVGVERRFVAPFDLIEPIDRRRGPRIVSGRRWRRACRALIAADTPPGSLRAARTARLDVLPHQLAPALAVVRGLGTRVLLADAVGLGKTIQAGLIVSELRGRGRVERVLVVAPAGLRDQWVQELGDRFAEDAVNVDAHVLRRIAAMLPIGVNPWSTLTTAVASIDYVKRAEVLPAVASCVWDVVIVDEAHGVAGDSERHHALEALTSRAAYVLLLTATPHNGDRRAFASLCELGSLGGDPLLVFRRTRSDIGMDDRRRVHTIDVRTSADERRMHALLARYSDEARAEHADAWLALSVLHKRALSSAWSLARSVERRLEALSAAGGADGSQLALPLGDPHGDLVAADESPSWPADLALSDPHRERGLLNALAIAARRAARHETKLAALGRLLRRTNESAIVFTEYRDTLLRVERALAGLPVLVLHGGMARDDRAAVLAAFARASRAVLLATDAAGEGLNLHQACRLVINLELPWNPMRLEQRIGRVDRIGQQRTVHAFHLIADGTGEARILARLKSRVARAQEDIGAPDPIDDERSIAHMVITGEMSAGLKPCATFPQRDVTQSGPVLNVAQPFPPALAWPSSELRRDTPDREQREGGRAANTDLRDASIAEAARLKAARAMCQGRSLDRPVRDGLKAVPYWIGDEAALAQLEATGPWIVRARRRGLRLQLGSRSLLLWRLVCEDGCGRAAESRLMPVVVERGRSSVADALDRVRECVADFAAEWRTDAERAVRAFAAARRAREHAMANYAQRSPVRAFQPGLFDRRAERGRAVDAQADASAARIAADRIALVELAAMIDFPAPELLMAIVPRR